MENLMLTATMMVALTVCAVTSIALADDFKTINGKEYKNATVSRVEADGITVKFSGGIVKIPFTDLPKDVQERFHYDPEKAAQFSASVQAAAAQFTTATPQQETQVAADNLHTIREVESDQPSFLDQTFMLQGTIEIPKYYGFGYDGAEETHYAFRISDSPAERCFAYIERAKAGNLRERLLSASSPLKGVFTVVLLSRRYYYVSNRPDLHADSLFVELLDYRLEQ